MKRLLCLVPLAYVTLAAPAFADVETQVEAPQRPSSAVPSDLPVRDPDGVIAEFQSKYAQMGRPKILLIVNRDVIRDRGEMMEMARVDGSIKTKGDSISEGGAIVQIGSGNSATNAVAQITGQGGERTESGSLSTRVIEDRNLGVANKSEYDITELENTFKAPFQDAGTRFVDQRIAELSNRTFAEAGPNFLTAPQTDKERQEIESLRKSADLVIHILVKDKSVVIPQVSGKDVIQKRVELTAKAVSLKDGIELATVASDRLFKFDSRGGARTESKSRKIASAEIIEQTALALMQRIQP